MASPLALLLVWELCARLHLIDTRFFPAPSSVMATLIDMLRSGELVTHTAISTSPMPMPSFRPVMITGSAPGSAMVQNVFQRLAL